MRFGGRAYSLDQIEEIAQLGFEFAEISLKNPSEVKADFKDLLRLRDCYHMSYFAHGPNEGDPLDVKHLSDEVVPTLLKLIELASNLEIPLFTIHFWMDSRFIDKEIWWEKLRLLERISTYGRCRGVAVCMENLSERVSDLSPAFEQITSLGLTLDMGHGQLMAAKNRAFGFMEHYPQRIQHIHLHDNRGGKRVKDDIHLPIGKGIIDFASLFRKLLDIGYRGTLTLEVKVQEMNASRQKVEEILRDIHYY